MMIFKSISFALVSFLLVSCGGGGGGGKGGGGNTPTYLNVSSTSPSNNQVQVSYDKNITIHFSELIDEDALVNTDANIAGLLEAKNIVAVNTQTEAVADTITIEQLKTGSYRLKYADSDALLIVTGAEWSGVGSSRKLTFTTASEDIVFTYQELNAAQLSKQFQNVVTLKNLSLGGIKVPMSLSVVGSSITLQPEAYYNWREEYQVTISTNLVSTRGHKLQSTYSFKFTSESQPEMRILNVMPLGQDANPMENIRFKTNFDVNVESLEAAVEVYTVLPADTTLAQEIKDKQAKLEQAKGSALKKGKYSKSSVASNPKGSTQDEDEDEREWTPVEGRIEYNSSTKTVSFIPNVEFDYSREYQVKVNTGENKITGTVGLAPLATLEDSETWEFTTTAPKVISSSPSETNGSHSYLSSISTDIVIDFNFRPLENTVDLVSIEISDDTGMVYYDQSYEVEDTKVTISPGSLGRWEYGRVYQVRVTPQVVSDVRETTHIAEDYIFHFSTERRKVIAVSPSVGNTQVPESNLEVEAQFNFDADPSTITEETFKVYSGTQEIFGQITYDAATRTAKFKTSGTYRYNQEFHAVVSDGVMDIDFESYIHESFEWAFETRNEELYIAVSEPSNGETYVPVLAEIKVVLNYPVEADSVDTGWGSYKSVQLRYVDDCSGTIYGNTRWDGNNILRFIPEDVLASDCRVEVSLDSDLRGSLGQEPEGSFDFYFDTDYVEIDQVYYYGYDTDSVEVNTDIEVIFSHDIEYVGSYDVSLKEGGCSGYSVSVTTSTRGNSLVITPYYDLDYEEDYCLRIEREDIEATTGETLAYDYSFEFNTESIPLEIVNYGPTGSYVSTYGEFWVLTNWSTSDYDFPDWEGDIYATYSGYVSSNEYESGYEVSVSSYSELYYDEDYEIDFRFFLDDGDITVSWDVTTEPDPNPPESESFSSPEKLSKAKTGAFQSILKKWSAGCLENTSCNITSSVKKARIAKVSEPKLVYKKAVPMSSEHQSRRDQRKASLLEKAKSVKSIH